MMRSPFVHALALPTFLAMAACSGAPETEAGSETVTAESASVAAGPSTVANSSPRGLIASTGNLYWTSPAVGTTGSTLWRTSKNSVPGAEIALYREGAIAHPIGQFGAVVYANVNGAYYGYFVANYTQGLTTSVIKRVSLAGGSATVLAVSPAPIGARDLVTDGSALYWADEGGIRTMSVDGGPITTLATGKALAHLSLDATNVIFTDERNDGVGNLGMLYRVPKAGGVPRSLYGTPYGERITALFVDPISRAFYWGEGAGIVRSWSFDGGAIYFHQRAMAGREVTAVGFDGTRVLWIDCEAQTAGSCAVRERHGGVTTTVSTGSTGAGHLQWDAASIYWGDQTGLRKYVW